MKKYKWNIILLVLVSLIIMFFVLKDDFFPIVSLLKNANALFIFFAILFMILNISFQSLSILIFLRKIQKDYKYKDAFILMVSAQFFNAITPFSSGGQPFQMYLLKKQGFKITDSGNILIQNFFTFQIALILMGTLSVVSNTYLKIIPETSLLKQITFLGYLANVLVLVVLVFLSVAKKINTDIFNKIINLVFNLKILKKKSNLKNTILEKVDDFYESSAFFRKNKISFVFSTTFNILSLVCLYAIPFFAFKSIDPNSTIDIYESIICSGFTLLIGSFVPIPGGTGGLEYGFLEFFKGFSTGAILSACMLLWRFITYYFGMLLGAVALLFFKRRDDK